MVITYPLLTVVDDSGAVVTGATVAITSVKDKAGTDVASPGATVHQSGANVSVDYDAEARGEAWVVLAVSKVGSTFTGLNAAPAFYLSQDPSKVEANLDAAVSTRSIFAGGAVTSVSGSVGSVVAPVTVGANNDKAGYALSGAGVDAVMVEANLNLRQAASLKAAAAAGVITGQETGNPVILGAGVTTPRISAVTNSSGDRTSVTITPPT